MPTRRFMKRWAKLSTTYTVSRSMSECIFRDLGLMPYAEALALQKELAEQRKRGEIPDHLLIVEHPHVITLGRNGHLDNLLASPDVLARSGISFHHPGRRAQITYH